MKTRNSQQGMALLILVSFLSLVALAYLVQSLNSVEIKNDRDKIDAALLAEAKTALLGLAIDQVSASYRPGNLPLPDRLLTPTETPPASGPPNYDGTADSCVVTGTGTATKWMCLGRLPWKDLGLPLRNPSENDPTGEMPWYSVSGNLVDAGCLNILNSDTLNWNYVNYTCNSSTLPHPWLTVRDKYGNVLSNRVAAVVIIPRLPMPGQTRPVSPSLAGAGQYLDSITVTNAAGCIVTHVAGTYNNAGTNGEFIMAEGSQRVDINDPCYQQPYSFNDKLIYITIDELMEAVEKRVAGEVRKNLLTYKVSNGVFPYAASIGYQGQSCEQNSNAGFLPLSVCNCTGSVCDCAFPGSIQFTSTNSYSAQTGSCSRLGSVCTCTGEGGCTRAAAPKRSFFCTSTGTCTSSITGTFKYTPAAPIINTTMYGSGTCTVSAGTATCTNAGSVTMPGVSNVCTGAMMDITDTAKWPAWFTENGWKHEIYYAKGALTVGASNASSLLIVAGKRVGAQTWPSGNLANYLDSVENTNGDTVFDAVGTASTSTYNDQMFIVAP